MVDKPGMCLDSKTGVGKMWACRFYFLMRRTVLFAMRVCRDASEMAVGLLRNSAEDHCMAYNSEWE